MAYLSVIPRQLAPTMGQEALQALQRARTKIFAGIHETIAIGRVLFSSNVPIVPPDEFWIPAKTNPTRCSIVPIEDIHLFIGETDSGTSSLGVGGASRPARTAYGQDMLAEGSMSDLSSEFAGKDRKASRPARTAYGQDTFTEGSMSDLSSEFAGKDQKNSRPTQTALVQDIKVEDHCKSAGFVRASGQKRSKFVSLVTILDLARCVQREGENPRDYLARWLRIRADLAHYPNDDAIYHFLEGLDHGTLLRHSLRRQQASRRLTFEGMVNVVNNYAEAEAATQTALAPIDGAPPIQPPPPPPAAIVTAAPPPPVIIEAIAPPPPVIEEALAPSESVIDALYADFSAVSEEIDFSPEELNSAMQEMEEEYTRDKQANNTVTSREVFVTIGTAMDEDQPGRAPPIALEKGKGPLIAVDDDRAKVMLPPPNPAQQPRELGTSPSNNNTANLPPPASTSAAAQVTPADRVMYGNLLVEPLTVAHIWNVTQLDEKRQQMLEEAQAIAEQGAQLDRDLVNAQKSIEKARAMEAEYKTLLQ